MSKIIKYHSGNHTDVGKKREINQDSFGSAKNDWGELFIVADGMGGHKGGEVASKISVETLCSEFKNAPLNISPSVFLDRAIQNAHEKIVSESKDSLENKGMGTTIVALILKGNEAHIAHVGDSRFYLFRKKDIWYKTKDHSLVQNLINQGLLKEGDAESHPEKNKITQALGVGKIEPEITNLQLYKNDYLLLCSDGLSGEVQDDEILEMILNDSPMITCKKLVDKANDRGGPDNITVITIHISDALSVPKNLSNSVTASRRIKNTETKKNYFPYIFLSTLIGFFLVYNLLIDQNLKEESSGKSLDPNKVFNVQIVDSTKKNRLGEADAKKNNQDTTKSPETKSTIVEDKEDRIGDTDDKKNNQDTTKTSKSEGSIVEDKKEENKK